MNLKRLVGFTLIAGCLVGIVWVGASLITGTKTKAASLPGQRWEYMVVSMEKKNVWTNVPTWSDKLVKAKGMSFLVESIVTEEALDEAGRQGWELVMVVEETEANQEFIFKRPIP